MKGDGGGRLERGGKGFELFDKVSRATAHGMTMTATREREWQVCQGHNGKKGPQLLTIGRKRAVSSESLGINSKLVQWSRRLPLDPLVHFSPSLLHALENIKALIRHQSRGHGGIRATLAASALERSAAVAVAGR